MRNTSYTKSQQISLCAVFFVGIISTNTSYAQNEERKVELFSGKNNESQPIILQSFPNQREPPRTLPPWRETHPQRYVSMIFTLHAAPLDIPELSDSDVAVLNNAATGLNSTAKGAQLSLQQTCRALLAEDSPLLNDAPLVARKFAEVDPIQERDTTDYFNKTLDKLSPEGRSLVNHYLERSFENAVANNMNWERYGLLAPEAMLEQAILTCSHLGSPDEI